MERAATLPSLFCTTMRRRKSLWLSCGTSLERIAAESLTRLQFDFVHGHISRLPSWGPLNQVKCDPNVPAHLNRAINPRLTPQRLRSGPHYCDRALVGVG